MSLQKWRRRKDVFEREAFGDEPIFSEVLGAWLLAEAGHLVIADDRDGTRRWLTELERERAEKERERAEKLALERELAELRARLGETR